MVEEFKAFSEECSTPIMEYDPANNDACTNGDDIPFVDGSIISDSNPQYTVTRVNDGAIVLSGDVVENGESRSVTVEQILGIESIEMSVDISSSVSTIGGSSSSCGEFCGSDHRQCTSGVHTPLTSEGYDAEPDTPPEYLIRGGRYDSQMAPPACVSILVELPDGQVVEVMQEADPTDIVSLEHIHVPEVVAAETVVTTALPRRRKQAFPTVVRSGLGSPSMELGSPESASDGSGSVWSPSMLQVDASGILSSASTCFEDASEAELSTSQESFVALVPNNSSGIMVTESGIFMPLTMQGASIRETTKRERDRLKKRELRQNPAFIERERVQAKSRMRNRRCDPEYRELERQKDRHRRRASRQQNIRQRQIERERDKTYKRARRNDQTDNPMAMSNGRDEQYTFDIGDATSMGLDE